MHCSELNLNNFKSDFLNIWIILHPQIHKYCPNHTSMERLCIHLKKATAGFVVQGHKCFGIISKAKENNNANEHTSEDDSYEKTAHLSFVKHSKKPTLLSYRNIIKQTRHPFSVFKDLQRWKAIPFSPAFLNTLDSC